MEEAFEEVVVDDFDIKQYRDEMKIRFWVNDEKHALRISRDDYDRLVHADHSVIPVVTIKEESNA